MVSTEVPPLGLIPVRFSGLVSALRALFSEEGYMEDLFQQSRHTNSNLIFLPLCPCFMCKVLIILLFSELFLDEEDVEKLHDFEEECMEDLFRQREHNRLKSNEERIRQTYER